MNKKLLIVLLVLLIITSTVVLLISVFKPPEQTVEKPTEQEQGGEVPVRPLTKEDAEGIAGRAFRYDFEQEEEIRYFLDDKMLIVTPSEENDGWETLWSRYRVEDDKIVIESDVEEELDIELKGNDLVLNGITYKAINLTKDSNLLGTWKGKDYDVTFLDDDYLIMEYDGDYTFYEYDIDDNQITLTSGELDTPMTFKEKEDSIRINGDTFRRTDAGGKEEKEETE